jgi:O-antigen/teichoic acid export membrane protein
MFRLVLMSVFQLGLLGADQSFLRMYHEKGESEKASFVWLCFFISITATIAISSCTLFFWQPVSAALFNEPDFTAMLLLACSIVLFAINNYALGLIRLSKRGHVLSAGQIAGAIAYLVTVVFYAKFIASTFHAIIWGIIAHSSVSILIYIFAERRFWTRKIETAIFNRAELKRILSYGLPMVPVLAVMFIFQGMDKIALRVYSPFEEIGLYAVASKYVFLLTLLQTGFNIYWAPAAFERYEADRRDYRFFENMFKYAAVATLAAGGALLLFKDIIILILAPSYRDAVYIMPFLIIAPIIHIVGDITGIGMGLKKRTHLYLIVALAGALVNLVGNFYLVPLLGARGAAISTGAAFLVYFYLRTVISGRLFPVKYPIMRFMPAFLVLVAFLGLNTFHDIQWWYNAIPILATMILHRSIIIEILKGLKSKD